MPPKPPNVPSTCFTRHSLRYLGSRSLEPGARELHVLPAEFGCPWPQRVHDLLRHCRRHLLQRGISALPKLVAKALRHLGGVHAFELGRSQVGYRSREIAADKLVAFLIHSSGLG